MNYYIQGDAANAGKIKAAFEKLGIDVLDFGFADKTLVYCSIGGCVQSLPYSINLMHILYSHPDYKELELPVEPKFKVGDDIKTGNTIETIAEIGHATRSYYCESGRTISFKNQDLWHLVAPKPHYDIANFKPFDKVLVRQNDSSTWGISFFGFFSGIYMCCSNVWYEQCIPFNDDTKHLLGTTDMCDEQYINW